MSLSELSYLSTVSAAVVFLFATMMHAAEWATATVRRQSAARGRQLAAATAGAKCRGDRGDRFRRRAPEQ